MSKITWFKDLTTEQSAQVGIKNALLGKIQSKLSSKGIKIPDGFVLDQEIIQEFFKNGDLNKKIKEVLKNIDVQDAAAISKISLKVQKMVMLNTWTKEMEQEIKKAIKKLGKNSVSIASSVVDKNLIDINLHKQEISFLNIHGEKDILVYFKKCLASLYSVAAIVERESKGIDHLSVGVALSAQEMPGNISIFGKIRTLDTESGFKGVVSVSAADTLVHLSSGADQFCVFKAGVKAGFKAIISRQMGSKSKNTSSFYVGDNQVMNISKIGMEIEELVGNTISASWIMDKNENIYRMAVAPENKRCPKFF